jgi:DNA repair exonuclease SbcCD ATPase subunit
MSTRFDNIRWKNFLSTGDNWTEINLNKDKSTLIVGHNGAGKSTLLDAISFALFGKPHRNINKPQLVNSVNNKDCVVEVKFTIGNNKFTVIRGIKPTIFEIHKNGVLLNQESHNKEYQKILEQNILKLNHKSFHQVVVLGSSSFIPFMQLPAQHRRDVIEDLLDINVFSKMNILLKEKMSILKDSIKDITYKLELEKNKIDTQKKYISDVKELTNTNIASKRKLIADNQTEIKQLQEQNSELSKDIDDNQAVLEEKYQKHTKKNNELIKYNERFKQQIVTVTKEAKFYEENDNCPSCSQTITSELKTSKIKEAKEKARTLKSAMDKAAEEIDKVSTLITDVNEKIDTLKTKQHQLHQNNQTISRLQNQNSSIEEELSTTAVADLNQANTDLEAMILNKESLMEKKLEYSDEYSYKTVIAEMLKDTGIKTKVIKQYLPVINKLVNMYLQVLDFFVHFDLDESFQETIRSRHRDSFSYDSFSEGEKQRIDLALLFTWRQIAKMKNSVSTNLLILDETFDSSLDADGVENLMKILYTLDEDTNVFVISHKGEILDGKFLAKIEFYKDKNFSKIK